MTEAAKSTATMNADPVSVAQNFWNDITSGANALVQHENGGAWAAIILSLALTAYVWKVYGAAAGAPLAASFFICLAMVMPPAPKSGK